MRMLLVTGLALGWVSSVVAMSTAANIAALFMQTPHGGAQNGKSV